ncbi:MAG: M20 family metallopeptidase [Isosphaeraceae bacterium]
MDPIPLLADLVAIPSINPMGRRVSGPEYFEGRVGDYLEGFFRSLGAPFERRQVRPGRDNLVARYEAPDAASHRTLLFDAHQDTVPVDGMTIDPFRPEVRGGRMYGRGACDIKSGLAAMLAAFARLCRERPRGSASVIMACTVDEEYTHLGSSQLVEDGIRADLAIIAEPTMLDLVTCHKGAIRWKVRAAGVACHSSTPERGDNAIYRMARIIGLVREYADTLIARPPHPILGPPTMSIGRIEGGQSVNIVPDGCEIEIDRRVIPGEPPGGRIDDLRQFLAGRLGPEDRPFVEFSEPWVDMPALSDQASRDWVGELSAVIARASGKVPRVIGVPYGTDAGPLAEAGMPCVVLGPGDIAQAHTRDEWIELDQVTKAAETYFQLGRSLGRPPREPILLA